MDATLKKQSGDAIATKLQGQALLSDPELNKGTAFTEAERNEFSLHGLLPPHVEDLEVQVLRAYEAYKCRSNDLERHIYLRGLQDENETLFYKLVHDHIAEMMPIIYTPVVGAACENFSHIYRHRRGLFIPFPLRNQIDKILDNAAEENVDVIVVTDGERILGLGDQGAGGMGIPIGKLSLYSLCGGIDPRNTLPIVLDVGTDNPERLTDPFYLGWRNERIRGEEYDMFVERFVQAVIKKFPNVLLQWEDFANQNARRLLEKYKDKLCTFNDDIQGTAAVALAGILAAVKASGTSLRNQQFVMFGAGSAGLGIADLLVTALVEEGATEQDAIERIWLIDRPGLLHSRVQDLQPAQRRYMKPWDRISKEWRIADEFVSLEDVVKKVKATVLIGTSAQPHTFSKHVVNAMAQNTQSPIIFPLSNPNSHAEATPAEILTWSDGRAIVATGSPFDPVICSGKKITIGQCNNSYIFPGLGLGVVASKAKRVQNSMFMAAARALAEASPALEDASASLFPPISAVRAVSEKVGLAVAAAAQVAGVAPETSQAELEEAVRNRMWTPQYKTLKRLT
jgi:malate dehydrogenase (oxaloacetate-decarboxylating)